MILTPFMCGTELINRKREREGDTERVPHVDTYYPNYTNTTSKPVTNTQPYSCRLNVAIGELVPFGKVWFDHVPQMTNPPPSTSPLPFNLQKQPLSGRCSGHTKFKGHKLILRQHLDEG